MSEYGSGSAQPGDAAPSEYRPADIVPPGRRRRAAAGPEPVAGREGPLGAIMTMWALTVVLIVLGGVLGAAVALVRTPQYTAEARLIVGSDNLSSYEVAGFAEASQELASNYSRYVDSGSTVSDSLERALGGRADGLISVSASPIAGSDVISVEVIADSSGTAVAGAKSVAGTLVSLTSGGSNSGASTLLSQYEALAAKAQAAEAKVTQLSGRLARTKSKSKSKSTAFGALRTKLTSARTASASLNLQQTTAGQRYQSAIVNPPSDSALSIIQPALIVSDDKKKTTEIYTFGGGIVGLFAAFVVANGWQARKARRRAA